MNQLALSALDLRRNRRILAFAAVLLVPLAMAGLVRWLVNPVAFTNRHIDRLERIAQRVLEQKLSVGSLEGHLYPELDVTIHDLVLSAKDPGEPPMLVLPAVQIRFRLRRALVTLGQELSLDAVHVEGGVLRVRRDRDGQVDVLEVLARLPPLDPQDLAGGVLSALRIDGVQVHVVDEARGEEVTIERLHIETLGPVALGEPLHATASASWGARQQPATAIVHIDRVPDDLVFWPPPPASLHLQLPDTNLANAIAWLGLPPLFAAGRVDVGIDAVTSKDAIAGTLDVRGTGLSALVTTGAGAGAEQSGAQGEARLRADVRVAVDGFRTEIDHFFFEGAGIGVEGGAVFLQPSLEGIEAIDVMAHAEELARLGLLIPPLRNTAPGALRLSGAATASLLASPSALALELELDDARVVIGEALSKAPGERLRVSLHGTRDSLAASALAGSSDAGVAPASPGRIDAALGIDLPRGVAVTGDLVFQPRGVDIAHFALLSRRTTLARAAALSPVLRDLVAGSVRQGSLAVAMLGRMSADDNAFDFTLDGRGLELHVDRTTVTGAALVNILARTDERGLRVHVFADLDDLAIETLDGGGAVLFEKPSGAGLGVRAALVEIGGPGSLGRALAGLDASAQQGGVFVGHGLSPRWRRIVLGMNGRGSVRSAHTVLMGIALDDADIELWLRRGRLSLDPALVHLFSGRASLAGSVVDLRAEPPSWSVALDVQGLELARLLEPVHGLTGHVEGEAAVTASLAGTGLSLESLLTSLDGPVAVRLHNVRIAAIDALSTSLTDAWNFLQSLPGVARRDIEQARGPSLAEALREGEWTAHFHGNRFRVDQPIRTLTSLGVLSLQGHAALDGNIELRARLEMSGEGQTVPVEASVTGTWTRPVVSVMNLDLLQAAALRSLDDSIATLKRSIEGWLGGPAAPRDDAPVAEPASAAATAP